MLSFLSTHEARSEIRRGCVASLPVILGYAPFALVLGAQAAQKDLSPWMVSLMTGLNFAGGSEFAAIELWSSPPHLFLIAAITFLINSRHILMGATLAPLLRHLPPRKAFVALFFMCDESWAMGLADAEKRAKAGFKSVLSLYYYAGLVIGLYSAWVIGTGVGAVIGPHIANIDRYGFDMAFPAVFLVLLRGMWKGYRAARPWLVSLLVAAATYYWVPGAWYVMSGTLAGLFAAYLWAGERA